MVPLFGFVRLRDHVEKVLGRVLLLQEGRGQGLLLLLLLLQGFARQGSGGGGELIGNGKRKHLREKVLLKVFQLFVGLQRGQGFHGERIADRRSFVRVSFTGHLRRRRRWMDDACEF